MPEPGFGATFAGMNTRPHLRAHATLRFAGQLAGICALFLALTSAAIATPVVLGDSMAATARLNVRGGPGLDHPVLDTLDRGERVLINDCRGDWCRITHVGLDGWVFAPYLVSATFVQTWSATSRSLPATLPSENGMAPDIGISFEIDANRRCPRTRPYC